MIFGLGSQFTADLHQHQWEQAVVQFRPEAMLRSSLGRNQQLWVKYSQGNRISSDLL